MTSSDNAPETPAHDDDQMERAPGQGADQGADGGGEMDALRAEIADLRDKLLRALAEAENTRRRAERQAADARAFGIDRFARDLLPVADALGRAIASLPEAARAGLSPDVKAFAEGVELTERTLLQAFERNGLKPTPGAGAAFDPNMHQAVAQIPSDHPAGSVAEVFQSGFLLAERTLRAAMVAVSLGRPAPGPTANSAGEG